MGGLPVTDQDASGEAGEGGVAGAFPDHLRGSVERGEHVDLVGLIQPGVEQLCAVVDGGFGVGGAVD
ncbi:hypothetical protein U6T76_12740, partial [Cutibacterium acnes]